MVLIFGELPVYPSQLFLPKYKNAIQKNEQANLQILKTIYETNLHIQLCIEKNEYLIRYSFFSARFL